MNNRTKTDYTTGERMHVVEGKSYREIGRIIGVSFSAVSAKARADDWKGKRLAYLNAIARRSYENVAESVAHEQAAIKTEAVLAGRLAIRKFIQALSEDKITINAKDAQLWAAFLLAEMTAGHTETSSEAPDVRNVTPPDTELLRRVVEAARERVAPAGDLGAAPLVIAANPRPN